MGVLWLCTPPASPPVRAPDPRRPGRAGAEVRRAGGPAAAVAGDRVGGAAQRHLRSGRGDHSRQRHRQRAPVVTRAARAGPRLPRPAQSPTRALARRRGPPRRRLRHAPALRRPAGRAQPGGAGRACAAAGAPQRARPPGAASARARLRGCARACRRSLRGRYCGVGRAAAVGGRASRRSVGGASASGCGSPPRSRQRGALDQGLATGVGGVTAYAAEHPGHGLRGAEVWGLFRVIGQARARAGVACGGVAGMGGGRCNRETGKVGPAVRRQMRRAARVSPRQGLPHCNITGGRSVAPLLAPRL